MMAYPPLDPYYEVKLLRAENVKLREAVEKLELENGDLLRKWISALDHGQARFVRALLCMDTEQIKRMPLLDSKVVGKLT